MKMNLPNKLTMFRIFLTLIIIVILLFPFHTIGIVFPLYMVDNVSVDSKYAIAGILFIIASLTDFLDGYIARKYNLVTDFGKMVDSIADKILVNSVLIILTAKGLVHPLITVTIIIRDSVTNAIKMVAGSKGKVVAARNLGKIKATFLMVGIILLLFSNLPFALINLKLKVADFLLVMATVLAVVSAIEYYQINKHLIFEKDKK